MSHGPSALPVARLLVSENPAPNGSLIIEGADPLPSLGAIGSFDGLHRGHQAILSQARLMAQTHALPLSLVTFDPHPSEILTPTKPPFRLMCLDQQISLARELGVDQILVLRFDSLMANLAPEQFLMDALKTKLKLRGLVFGFDFRFGAKGAGTPSFLHQWAKSHEFLTHELAAQLTPSGEKWSSSMARNALMDGDLMRAQEILGRHFEIMAKVENGQQLGRQLGFPTLNLDMGRYLTPKHGVYISRTRLKDGRCLPSISNLGLRPTIDGKSLRFETHIFDFHEDLYDQYVRVELIDYLRTEKGFDGLEALKAQITKDCLTAREFHRRLTCS